MYKNVTKYDLDLIMLSQKGMIKQTRIGSLIFAFAFIVLAIVSVVLKKIDIAICLFVATGLVLILFVGLPEVFLKLQMKKNLKNHNVEIEYVFGNTLNITSKVNDQTITQSFDYNKIVKMIEEKNYLLICLANNDALIMKIDDQFYEYKNFIKKKMQNRYVEKLKNKKDAK